MQWTEDKYLELEALHEQHLSRTKIARIMGVTRNAISGACWRRGLTCKDKSKVVSGERTPEERAADRQYKEKARSKKGVPFIFGKGATIGILPPTPPKLNVIDLEIPLHQRKNLLQLDRRKHCCWPVGHPKEEGFFYCGADKQEGSVYCDAHMQRAHKPSYKRRAA